MDIITLLKEHEGKRLFPYNDATGRRLKLKNGCITIGFGRNLQVKGINDLEADILLLNDIDEVVKGLSTRLPLFRKLNETRQGALIDMAFNMGVDGLLEFNDTFRLIELGNWEAVGKHLKERSLWYKQHKRIGSLRADRIISYLVSGSGLSVWKPISEFRDYVMRKKKKNKGLVGKVVGKVDGKKTKSGIVITILGVVLDVLVSIFPELKEYIPPNSSSIIMESGLGVFVIGIIHKIFKVERTIKEVRVWLDGLGN